MSENRNQLRDRALKATPGPWQHERLGIIQGGPMQTYVNGAAMPQLFTSHGADFMEPGEYLANADFVAAANPAAVMDLLDQVEQLEKSLKLVQSHAHTAYTRGRQAGIADQERTAREAIAAMVLARDQMMDENERFTGLLEKAEHERDQLKAENARWQQNYEHLIEQHMPRTGHGCEEGWSRVIEARELQAENEELRRDAERYRWLRNKSEFGTRHDPAVYKDGPTEDLDFFHGDELDAAIDQAMTKEQQP